jgi:hypothetical protein
MGCAMMRSRLAVAAAVLATVLGCGCAAVEQTPVAAPPPEARVRPLPFKGRLAQGDPSELPPAVAASLSSNAAVSFSYREELTHEYHIPRLFTALDPVTYLGAPLGDYGVTAFASLTITEGDRVLGDYTAKAHVSKSYTLYSEPTHAELERAARAAVRQKIDGKLLGDADTLARAVAGAGPPAPGAAGK